MERRSPHGAEIDHGETPAGPSFGAALMLLRQEKPHAFLPKRHAQRPNAGPRIDQRRPLDRERPDGRRLDVRFVRAGETPPTTENDNAWRSCYPLHEARAVCRARSRPRRTVGAYRDVRLLIPDG